MDLLSASAVIFLSISSLIYAYFKFYAFEYWKSKRIPFIKPSFPFGSVSGLGRKYHCSELLKKWYDAYKPSGAKLVGSYLFATPIAVVLDLELVKNIFIRDFWSFDEKMEYFDEINEPLSGRLSHFHGERWKNTRVKLTPAFSSAKMKAMFRIVVEMGKRFCACLNESIESSDDDKVEIFDWCKRYVTDNMASIVLGIECNSLNDPNAEFVKYVRKMGLYVMHSPLFLALLNGFESVGRFFHVKTIPTDVSAFILKTVADTIAYRRKNGIHRGDFIDILVDANDNGKPAFTFNEVAANAMAFFIGSFNNAPTNLAFCLYELSINPEIQMKARNVVEDAFEKHNGQFTYEMMMDLPYIDQIIEETLRKYSVPMITRMTTKDYAIPDTNIVIDKGTRLLIPVHAIHHDPEYYPDPERFDPDRFENKAKNARDPIKWLPFGSGPRTCIGQRFAMIQARVAIALLLKNFEFSLDSETTIPLQWNKRAIMCTPQHGVYLKVKRLKS